MEFKVNGKRHILCGATTQNIKTTTNKILLRQWRKEFIFQCCSCVPPTLEFAKHLQSKLKCHHYRQLLKVC